MKKSLMLYSIMNLLISLSMAQTPDDFSFVQSFKVSTPAKMMISTNDGFINAYARNSNDIQVFFIVKKNNRVLDMDLEELEEYVTVDINSTNDAVEIVIKQKESDWIKNWKERHNVSLHILAPAQTTCDLKSSDGNIELYGFNGNQNCKTSDGDILVEDIEGNLYGKTSDGDISVTNVDGDLELSTSDGDINAIKISGKSTFKTSDGNIVGKDLYGDAKAVTSDGNIILENVRGNNSARTSDGNISFEHMTGSLNAQTSDGDIRGDFNSLSDKLYLKTSDGDISVTVPNGLGMDIRLKGEDIHTILDNFSGNTSDHLIEGTIRGGGVEVELVTSDGDINLNYH